MNRTVQIAMLLAMGSLFGLSANSQQPTATVNGTVMDSNGAVIPNATVTATNTATNSVRTVVSNSDGKYSITNITVGTYQVKFGASGFKELIRDSVLINVGQTITVNATMQVGEVSIIEDLFGDTPAVDTQTSKVDAVIDARSIENLPLNGRNFLELALLTPGNSLAPNFDPTKTNTVVISSAGQIGRGGNVMVDGTDNNDDVVGGALINVSQDAVQEFQVATNRFSAEYGRTGSAVINVVTKGGTNTTHGSVSFFERDRRLQGLPATFDRRLPTPPFDRQQYSFTLGGPLIKDKLFGFGSVEYRDQNGAVSVGIRDVPHRVITNGLANAPLKDLLLNGRIDYLADPNNQFNFRYSFENATATGPSKLDRALGSASYLQALKNRFHSFMTNWTHIFSPTALNSFSFSVNDFTNTTDPTSTGIQYTFPSILDGSSFRVPQATKQNRIQVSDSITKIIGNHTLKFGGEFQFVRSSVDLGVFRQGRVEFVEDFATFDHNGDGQINDKDLLFSVTLRSGFPNRNLTLNAVNNNYIAGYIQDDWRALNNLTFNFGLRYEVDTNVKNNSGYGNINPLVASFYHGRRRADLNNVGPRVGFNYVTASDKLSFHGGYGIYYDRVVLELITLERGLDGRALPVEVRAGNVFYVDQNTGQFPPGAPTSQNPFTGFILPGAGASGINIIDNSMQNPMVQQSNLGVQWSFARDLVLKVDFIHNFGTHFIIGRDVGSVFNPVVGGPDRVVNLESSVKTYYDAAFVTVEKRLSNRYMFRASYTLSKAYNYANDDQIPFSNGPIDPNNLRLEFGPTPNDQRHRFSFSGTALLPWGINVSPILTLASGVPMDIILPNGQSRVPTLQRNAGGRLFKTAADLNAFIQSINARGGVNGTPLPLAPANARFNDNFSSLDVRLSKTFTFKDRFKLEPIIEVFNLFNTTNILGTSNTNYSGFGNVLGTPSFGQPVSTAGGVFGSGGPRAFQIAGRFTF